MDGQPLNRIRAAHYTLTSMQLQASQLLPIHSLLYSCVTPHHCIPTTAWATPPMQPRPKATTPWLDGAPAASR